MAIAPALEAAGTPPMSEVEIDAEIKAARAERRALADRGRQAVAGAMRFVLDNNLVLSALLWRGTPYRLLDAIRVRHPQAQIYISAMARMAQTVNADSG